MANSILSYQDIIRAAAKKLQQPVDSKEKIQVVAKVYTSISKYLNYQFKKANQYDVISIDIPYLGSFTLESQSGSIKYHISSQLAEEAGISRNQSKDQKTDDQKTFQSDLSLGKVADVCLVSRDQIKTIFQYLISEIALSLKQGFQIVFDLRLESHATKVLLISKQTQEFVEKGQLHVQLGSMNNNKSFDHRDINENPRPRRGVSQDSTKISLFQYKLQTPISSFRSHNYNKANLTSGFSKTRKLSTSGAAGLTNFEKDPYNIINKVIEKQQQKNIPLPALSKSQITATLLSPNLSRTTRFESELRNDQLEQIRQKKIMKEFESHVSKEVEQSKIEVALKQIQIEDQMHKTQKITDQQSIKEALLQQQKAKILRKEIELAESKKFEYQFPFNQKNQTAKVNIAQSMIISPKNLQKDLPLQFDIQTIQHAARILKDNDLAVTNRSANNRVLDKHEQLIKVKLQEKEEFYKGIQNQQQEDSIKSKLRKRDMLFNRGILEQQMRSNREKREQQKVFENSYTSGVQWMDVPEQKNTFNNFGPDDNPERVEFYNRKLIMEKEFIREQLKKQIKDNEQLRQRQKSDGLSYGQKLGELANAMQVLEGERKKKQLQAQSEQLKQAWEEQRKLREQNDKIQNLFK